MDSKTERLLYTVTAVGMLALSCWPPLAPVAVVLAGAGGTALGKVWMKTPEDAREHARRKSLAPPPPAGKPPKIPTSLCLFLLALLGCAGSETATEAHDRAEAARAALGAAGVAVTGGYTAASLACQSVPLLSPDATKICEQLKPGYELTRSTLTAGGQLVDAFEDGLVEAEDLETALGRIRTAVQDMLTQWRKVEKFARALVPPPIEPAPL